MGLWRREEEIFRSLSEDRKANIEIVFSAYRSVAADKAYLTMPVTTGKRFYDVLDHYGVKNIEELEKKKSGALREEIILPNIEEAKHFSETLSGNKLPLVVPGVFEALKQRWSQDEYMILWLRLITSSIKELWLSDGWEYSNGGAIEFCRGVMIQFRFVEGREDRLPIYDHNGNIVDLVEGAWKLATAIKDLARRGHETTKLRVELGQVVGIAAYLYDQLTDRQEWALHTGGVSFDSSSAIRAAQSVNAPIAFDPTF